MLFHERLREARKRKGFSQRFVAKTVGIDGSTICNYEKGTREPNISTLKRLAGLYAISIDSLCEMEVGKWISQEEYERYLAFCDYDWDSVRRFLARL